MILGTHRAPNWFGDFHNDELSQRYGKLVVDLANALEDAGAAYAVAETGRRLVERVDPTVAAAVQHAISDALPTAG